MCTGSWGRACCLMRPPSGSDLSTFIEAEWLPSARTAVASVDLSSISTAGAATTALPLLASWCAPSGMAMCATGLRACLMRAPSSRSVASPSAALTEAREASGNWVKCCRGTCCLTASFSRRCPADPAKCNALTSGAGSVSDVATPSVLIPALFASAVSFASCASTSWCSARSLEVLCCFRACFSASSCASSWLAWCITRRIEGDSASFIEALPEPDADVRLSCVVPADCFSSLGSAASSSSPSCSSPKRCGSSPIKSDGSTSGRFAPIGGLDQTLLCTWGPTAAESSAPFNCPKTFMSSATLFWRLEV
mmetsp:Transcript_18697/g.44899  ORF Transcript_18697/g.44899 Transcript_18697/m.44899 type:complete len:309 (-) Transcript_18697:930-1856(-)